MQAIQHFAKHFGTCGLHWYPEAQAWREQGKDPQPGLSSELPEEFFEKQVAGAYPGPTACECLAMGSGER